MFPARLRLLFSISPIYPSRLFIDGDRMSDPGVREHLLLDSAQDPEFSIQVLPYDSILTVLKSICDTLSPHEKVWLSDKASYALTQAIPKVCRLWQGSKFLSPPQLRSAAMHFHSGRMLPSFLLWGCCRPLVLCCNVALKPKPSSPWVAYNPCGRRK